MEGSNTLEEWQRGEPIAARKLNQVVGEVNRLSKGVNAPVQKPSDAKSSGGTLTRQFKIKSITENYLVCNAWDGTEADTAEINVAKPPSLRHELTHNGVTYSYSAAQTRTATADAGEETQVVVRAYVIDDVIYAAKGIKGGVGVSVGGDGLEWIDLNLDARAWALQAAEE